MFEDCPVEILQVESEFAWLFDIYTKLESKRTLEIGSFYGGSLYYWLKGASEGATVLSVDFLVARTDDRRPKLMDARSTWGEWVKGTDKRLISIVGNSMDESVVARVKEYLPEVDFLYIDANHTENACWQDVRNYWPLVRKGGIMAMHDISNHAHGVHTVWDWVKQNCEKWQEKMDVPEYCGMGVAWK
jgi:predicted O-methyltransferase YrrM